MNSIDISIMKSKVEDYIFKKKGVKVDINLQKDCHTHTQYTEQLIMLNHAYNIATQND